MGDGKKEDMQRVLDAAKRYYAACEAQGTLPEGDVLRLIETQILSGKSIETTIADGGRTLVLLGGAELTARVPADRSARVIAVAHTLEHMPWVSCAELGGNTCGHSVLPYLLDACRSNFSLKKVNSPNRFSPSCSMTCRLNFSLKKVDSISGVRGWG